MFGNRMAVYDDLFTVLVRNDLRQFFFGHRICFSGSSSLTHYCHIDFINKFDFIENVVLSKNANSSFFIYTGQHSNYSSHFIGIVYISSNCSSSYVNRQYFNTDNSLEEYDIYTVSVDHQGLFGYVIGWDISLIYDLTNFQLNKFNSTEQIWKQIFKPYDFLLLSDNKHGIVVGYSFLVNWSYELSIGLIEFQPPNNVKLVTIQILSPNFQSIEEDQLVYSFNNNIVVTMNQENEILIGVPIFDLILFAFVSTNQTNNKTLLHLTNFNISWNEGGIFGKSLTWLDNETFAVLCYSQPVVPWSSSEVLFFHKSKLFDRPGSQKPDFSYPNNQQILDSSLGSPKFSRILSTKSGSLLILLNSGHIQLLCSSPPGFYTKTTKMISKNKINQFYESQFSTCLAGTYKTFPSVGPCFVCPMGTKNPKRLNATDIQCEQCDSNSFCPLSSIDDVANDPFTIKVNEILNYPEDSESNSFDDILIQNIFKLKTSSTRCLITSPLFWTLITISIVLFVIMLAGLFRILPKFLKHYLIIKEIFKRIDLIGEGELWIGGLMSFSVVVLIMFAGIFSGTFLHLYPIEQSSESPLSCDQSVHNSRFSSGFRLLSMSVNDDEMKLFEMLNSQRLTVSIDLLNTLVSCENIQIKLKYSSREISLADFLCNQTNSAVLSIKMLIPNHFVTIDMNISTSYSIGGLRLCLNGPELVEGEAYKVKSLNSCEFFGNLNETIGHKSQLNVFLTKIINKTEPLIIGDPTFFSGTFIPTINAEGTSDQFLFDLQGEYKRYLVSHSSIEIALDETQFFILNREDPIVRQNELVFHNIVFAIAVIELFGFAFLIFKLILVPSFHFIIKFYLKKHNRIIPSQDGKGLESIN